MTDVEAHHVQGAPDLVSITTQEHAVIICEWCGVIWEAGIGSSYEIPEAIERHADRHINGDLRED